MSTVTDRIEQAPACEVINLTEAEKHIYTGCGWKLARFRDGQLFDLFDPMNIPVMDTLEESVEASINTALGWLSAIGDDEAWLVMCSCYQLCEPRRITPDDAGALASMANRFAEQFEEWQ